MMNYQNYNNTNNYNAQGQIFANTQKIAPVQPSSNNTDFSSELLRRFHLFDRNQDGFLTKEELRALIYNFYGEQPPQAVVDTIDEYFFLGDRQAFDYTQTLDLTNKVRQRERSAPATTTHYPNTAPVLALMPAPSQQQYPQATATPFGVVSNNPNGYTSNNMYPQASNFSAPSNPAYYSASSTPSYPQQQQTYQNYQQAAPSYNQSNNFSSNPSPATPVYAQSNAPAFNPFTTPSTAAPTPFDPFANSSTPAAPVQSQMPSTASAGANAMAISIAAVASAGGLPSAARSQSGRAPVSSGPSTAVDGHYISVEEERAFSEYINSHPVLSNDPALKGTLPLRGDALYKAVSSGVLFCKFLNAARAGTVPENQIKPYPKTVFECTENQLLAIAGAKKLGCSVVNIGASDLIEGKAHLVLGMIWQIIRVELLSKVSIQQHPELCRLITKGNSATGEEPLTLQQMQQIAPEEVLLRWMNHHLRNAGYNKNVTNFSSDVKDGSVYTVLLNRIAPGMCSLDPLRDTDPSRRCQTVVDNAARLGCSKFVTPSDIMSGNQRLNLAFVADLFNAHPGISLPSMDELERLRQQNAEMASVLAATEARLRQLAMDRQLAEELQNEEINSVRRREAERQRELAEGEAAALAIQRAEEARLEEESRRRAMELQQSEAYIQRESQNQRSAPPTAAYPSSSSAPRAAYPSSSSSSYSSSSSSNSYSSAPRPSAPRPTVTQSRTITSYAAPSHSSSYSGYSSGSAKGLFERAGRKIDKKVKQVKDVRRYN